MQVIDGSTLEGGGQILRNSIALSALLRKPVVIENIRKGRTPPGLKSQHRTGLELAAKIASAELIDASNASTRIIFKPDGRGIPPAGQTFAADAVTAGSTTLLLQIALPILLFTPRNDSGSTAETTLILQGGTNAEHAPQIDYILHVFLPMLRKHFLACRDVESDTANAAISAKCERRGYYPKGGGVVHVHVTPLPPNMPLQPIKLLRRGRVLSIRGIAHYADLPASIGAGMVQGALERLKSAHIIAKDVTNPPGTGPDFNTLQNPEAVQIECKREPRSSTTGAGSGIVLWAELEGGALIGGSAVGRKGSDPAHVGAQAVEQLIASLESQSCVDEVSGLCQSCVDEWLQDQFIIFMALAQGKSELCCGTREITLHTRSAIWVAEQMTGAKFEVVRNEMGINFIRCRGIGFCTSSPE